MKTEEDEEFERVERESGWRKRQIALDQKAENAKELGLDYEPAREPVAWVVYTQEGQYAFVTDNPAVIHPSQRALPLYATPQRTWVGLTDEEIQQCLNGLPTQTIDVYARRIEAKLKEKNA